MLGAIKSRIKGKLLKQLISISCAVSFCLYGYDAGVLGGVQNTEPFLDAMGHPTGTYVLPMIASSYTLAAIACPLAVLYIGMPIGRRGCILLGNLLVIIGGILQATAFSVPHIIVGRVFCGFAIGFISSAIPTYQAEMGTQTSERGPDVAKTCAFLISGIAVAYWVDLGFTRMDNQLSWRLPIAFQSLFGIVAGGIMLVLPDTPRWYYARGRVSEGDETVARLLGTAVEDPRVVEMRESVLASIALENSEAQGRPFSLLDLLWDRSDLQSGKRIRISFMILSLQQMMGINLSVYYSTVIFSQVGLSPFTSQLLAAVMNTLFAAGTVPLVFTIERFGRRNIMIWSAVALTICLAIFIAMIALDNPTPATQWTAVAAILVYNMIFGYGWVGVPWLYGPEIAPLKLRHAGAAAGAFGEWLFSFIAVFAGGVALQNIGWKIWLWMMLSCLTAVPFVYFLCPETSGKALEEIDLLFAKAEVKERMLAGNVADGPPSNEKIGKEAVYVESA